MFDKLLVESDQFFYVARETVEFEQPCRALSDHMVSLDGRLDDSSQVIIVRHAPAERDLDRTGPSLWFGIGHVNN